MQFLFFEKDGSHACTITNEARGPYEICSYEAGTYQLGWYMAIPVGGRIEISSDESGAAQ